MTKTILITGATDGIGLEAAKMLAEGGHTLLLHGRNPQKLESAVQAVKDVDGDASVSTFVADLSDLEATRQFADQVKASFDNLDVLINNAGVLKAPNPIAPNGMDVRFVVNTHAPYLLTKALLPVMGDGSRVVNLSSAAQAPINIGALAGKVTGLEAMDAYAQSKLAITMWSRVMVAELQDQGIMVVAVNPGSLLASKMVKEGFGIPGNDIRIGADILARAALSDEFAGATGQYFDNDSGQFASPHPDALDADKCMAVVEVIENQLVITG